MVTGRMENAKTEYGDIDYVGIENGDMKKNRDTLSR